MSITTKSVEGVVTAGLCTSCGTCVAICPKAAVSMAETPGGLFYAQVDTGSCITCSLCLRACGGTQLAPGLLPVTIDPFKGEVLAAYCGYAADPAIRIRGQSGGVVTALLAFMLESGRADQALVNRMPEDGTQRPQPFWAHDKDELLASQGSKYCPVELNTAIPRDIGKNGRKSAVVGLPCHLHSLRNVQQFNAHWKTGIECTIGLLFHHASSKLWTLVQVFKMLLMFEVFLKRSRYERLSIRWTYSKPFNSLSGLGYKISLQSFDGGYSKTLPRAAYPSL